MKKSILPLTALVLLATALAGTPAGAQTTNQSQKATPRKPAADTQKSDKKPAPGPFHGKLAALDKAAKTITVGKRTFQITSETRIKKAGNPATLDEGVVGEEVSGYAKPAEPGKWVATTVNFGPKAAGTKGPDAKKSSKEKPPQ